MSTDPTTQIQSLLNNYATNHIGVVAGIISPEVSGGSASLPLHNLANYSSGFPTDNNGSWVPSEYLQTLPALLEFLANRTNLPQYPTGTCYSYSNFGWALLAIAAKYLVQILT